jgi:DnaJ-class molecular chaperone
MSEAKCKKSVKERCDCQPCQGTGMGGFYPGSRCHYCNGKGWTLAKPKEDRDE